MSNYWEKVQGGYKAFTVRIGKLEITVVWDHPLCRNLWTLHCVPFFMMLPLKSQTEDQAKAETLKMLGEVIVEIAIGISELPEFDKNDWRVIE